MRLLLRLYNNKFSRITVIFKHTVIINILFIGLAYPLSNTYENNFIKIEENSSILMQKAFEAEMLFKNRDFQSSAEIYYELSLKSDDPEVSRRATQVAGYANNYDLMLKISDRWLELSENKDIVLHVRVSILLTLNKVKQATKEIFLLIKNSKDKDKYALVYDTIKVFDDKVIKEIFDKIYAKYKNDFLANFYYVQVLLNNEDYNTAIDVVKHSYKFSEFSKKESRWGIFLADAYFGLGEDELCIDTLKDYLFFSPKDLYLNQYYVRILTFQKKYKDAIKHYRFMSANKLIDFSEKSTAKKMALLNIEAGNFIDAKTFIDSLQEKDINIYHYLNGIYYLKKNDLQKAERSFIMVDTEDDNYINSVHEIANIKFKNKQITALKDFFQAQYKRIKNNSDLEKRLILTETEVFFNEKKFNYSMKRINYGLKKYKDNGAFLYTRALVAEKINRLDILEEDLKKLINLEPNNAQALNALGYTWANNNINLNEANQYIDEALLLEPNDAAILDSKGWVLYKMAKYKEAEIYFVKALKFSQDTEIVSHFIQLLIKLGKFEKAKKLYSKHISNYPNDEKLIKLKKIFNEI